MDAHSGGVEAKNVTVKGRETSGSLYEKQDPDPHQSEFSRIRIRIKMKRGIRTRIEVMRIGNPGTGYPPAWILNYSRIMLAALHMPPLLHIINVGS